MLVGYSIELHRVERRRYPTIDTVVGALGGDAEVTDIPIPFDCTDGFTKAFFGRPEASCDPGVRRSRSAWTIVEPVARTPAVEALRSDLESGAWDRRYGRLRTQPVFAGSLRQVVSRGTRSP